MLTFLQRKASRGALYLGRKGGKMRDSDRVYSKEELLQYLYKYGNIPVILFAKDKEGKYVYASENTEDVNWIDGGKEHSVLGKTDLEIQCDKELGKFSYEQDQEIIKTGKSTDTYSEIDDKGEKHIFEVKKNPVYENGEILGISGIISEVTELVELKRKFEELSYMDTFTQCYNRNYFLKKDYDAKQYLPCTYIMCDCNDLKKVNDSLGHSTGDKYIKNTVKILKSVLPEDGICIRWGGHYMEIKKEYEPFMKDIFRALPATLFIKDREGKYAFTTKVCDLVNAGSDGTIIGKWDYEIQYDKELGKRYYIEDMHIIEQGISTHTVDEIVTEDGVFYMEIIKRPIFNDEKEAIGIVGVCNDVTEITRLRNKYERLSLQDPMTGVYNRNYTMKFDFDNQKSLPCSYIFCDCDGLKKINDQYGHNVGDCYIRDTVTLLQGAALENSIIIRWGGDEFLVVTPNIDRHTHNELVRKIKNEQMKFRQGDPDTGLSVGDMLRTDMSMSLKKVIEEADNKMYLDKKSLKNIWYSN